VLARKMSTSAPVDATEGVDMTKFDLITEGEASMLYSKGMLQAVDCLQSGL
jgi:hypothetical protein